jgi:hypothetical protein
VAALSKSLTTARTAIGEQNYEIATAELTKASGLSKVPAHVARIERLQQLNHYSTEFRKALRESTKSLKAGQTVMVKTTAVGVVETFANEDKIILRVAGMNRTYRFADLPVGLAVAIADLWLDPKEQSSLLIKAAFVLGHKSANEDTLSKARQWLEEAKGALPEPVSQLAPVLEDKYDNLQKDVDDLPKDA